MITDAQLLLFAVAGGFPVLFFLIILFMDLRDSGNCKFLYFESEKIARMISQKVLDGRVKIKKKIFQVDNAVPPVIKSGLLFKSYRPLYFIKHDRAVPFKIDAKGFSSERSPENLKNLIENKTLDQLLTPKQSGGMQIIMIAIGLVIGFLMAYALISSGMIKMS